MSTPEQLPETPPSSVTDGLDSLQKKIRRGDQLDRYFPSRLGYVRQAIGASAVGTVMLSVNAETAPNLSPSVTIAAGAVAAGKFAFEALRTINLDEELERNTTNAGRPYDVLRSRKSTSIYWKGNAERPSWPKAGAR